MSEDRADLKEMYEDRRELLTTLCSELQTETSELLTDLPHIDRISFRVKAADRFLTKVKERPAEVAYADPLREVEDQVAGRVLVLFRTDLDIVMKAIADEFTSVELRHKAPPATEFGYESDHSIFKIPPHVLPTEWKNDSTTPVTFELQVRTLFQHAWAEPQHDLGYKGATGLSEESERELAWAAASAWGADQALQRVADRLAVSQ
jgi:putative GTP pyrophosphokinase